MFRGIYYLGIAALALTLVTFSHSSAVAAPLSVAAERHDILATTDAMSASDIGTLGTLRADTPALNAHCTSPFDGRLLVTSRLIAYHVTGSEVPVVHRINARTTDDYDAGSNTSTTLTLADTRHWST